MSTQPEGRPIPTNSVILVGIDGGAGSVAVLQSAARLADLVGGSILVAHVVAAPQGPAAGYVALEDSSLGDIEADLFPEVVEALVDSRAGWTITTAYGNPASELVRLARQHEAAAIVVGADTPGWTNQLRRISTGSVPSRLVHQQPAPVIVIPEGCSRRPALSGS